MTGQPVIQTHELTKIYRHPFFTWLVRARAVTDLSLAVRQGEVFGLLGPNGSGKSTTIKLILGLIFPTGGQVAVFGKRPGDLSVKARIGFLPEESYLYRFLDAEETLDFYGRLFKIPSAERARRIDALLEMVGLRQERKRPVAEFSKGMQRRIGIAQAMINDPDLIILDEPTTGLDPLGTREIKDLILHLKEKGKTVLLSSHLLADVEDVCDRISILYGGRSRAEGSVQEVLQHERFTQVTAEMDESTVREVVELIRKRQGGASEITVAPPVERLENFFLRVVKEAQESRAETSGVQGATGRLDFLTTVQPEGEALLEHLAAVPVGSEPNLTGAAAAVRAIETPSAVSQQMLNRLASGAVESEDVKRQNEDVAESSDAQPQQDQTLLDKLVSGDKDE